MRKLEIEELQEKEEIIYKFEKIMCITEIITIINLIIIFVYEMFFNNSPHWWEHSFSIAVLFVYIAYMCRLLSMKIIWLKVFKNKSIEELTDDDIEKMKKKIKRYI